MPASSTGCGFEDPNVRLIVYPHVLASRDQVVEWMKGTLLTEYERHLPARLGPVYAVRRGIPTPARWPARGVAAVLLSVQADDCCWGRPFRASDRDGLKTVPCDRPLYDPGGRQMLKGTRDGILKKVQPTSIHGQVSWDVFFTDVEDPDGQTHVARIGPEAVIGQQHGAWRSHSGRVSGRPGGPRHTGRADIVGVGSRIATLILSLSKVSQVASWVDSSRRACKALVPLLDPHGFQIDARVRGLPGPRRRFDRLDRRHAVHHAAERGVDAVERGRRPGDR